MQVNWLDILILVFIGLSVITGLIRGFVKELIALSVWVLAIWLALKYYPVVDPWLQKFIVDKTIRTIVAFIIILLGTLIAGGIVNALLSFILQRSGLSGTDRLLGMGFGFIRGIFMISLILVAIKMTSVPIETYTNKSLLYAKFDPIVNWISGFVPDFIKKVQDFENNNIDVSTLPLPTEQNKQNLTNKKDGFQEQSHLSVTLPDTLS